MSVLVIMTWRLIGADLWEFTNDVLLKAPARVMWAVRSERESKNFRWKAVIYDEPYWFRTEAGAKQYVENYFASKGKI